MNMIKEMMDHRVRIANTAKQRCFTIAFQKPIFDLLGGKFGKVSVVCEWADQEVLSIKVWKDKNGKQLLRNISTDELGLRINTKEDNPVPFPFKSISLPSDKMKVDRENCSVEISLPFESVQLAKEKTEPKVGNLFKQRLPLYNVTCYPKQQKFGTKIVFYELPAANEQKAKELACFYNFTKGIELKKDVVVEEVN